MTTFPASGSTGTWSMVVIGIATIAKSPAAAAWAGGAADARGPRSETRPASESGPWELLSTTSYPCAIAAWARLLPTCPLPMIPMVVMLPPPQRGNARQPIPFHGRFLCRSGLQGSLIGGRGLGASGLQPGRLADGRDYLAGPAGQRLGGGGVVRAAVDEAARAVFKDRVGQLVDPLPFRAADPAPVVAAGHGERLGRDAAAEIEDVGDLGGIPAGRSRGVIDPGPGLAVQIAPPV